MLLWPLLFFVGLVPLLWLLNCFPFELVVPLIAPVAGHMVVFWPTMFCLVLSGICFLEVSHGFKDIIPKQIGGDWNIR